jgi:hypothetical protein
MCLMLGAVAAGTACVPEAPPAPTGTIAPNPVPIPAIGIEGFTWKDHAATVTWSGLGSGAVGIVVCERAHTDPAFVSVAQSCATGSGLDLPAGPGSGTSAVRLFRGESPDGDDSWGCGVPGDVAPVGVTFRSTCFVRISTGPPAHPARAVSVPFTLVDAPGGPDPVVPDLPISPALVVLGGGSIAGAVGLARNRRRRSA